jgi:hypothetical protein
MGLFRRRAAEPIDCPICGASVGTPLEAVESGHFLTHLEDRPGGRIGLMCGHADAEWDIAENFPEHALDHLRRAHGVAV